MKNIHDELKGIFKTEDHSSENWRAFVTETDQTIRRFKKRRSEEIEKFLGESKTKTTDQTKEDKEKKKALTQGIKKMGEFIDFLEKDFFPYVKETSGFRDLMPYGMLDAETVSDDDPLAIEQKNRINTAIRERRENLAVGETFDEADIAVAILEEDDETFEKWSTEEEDFIQSRIVSWLKLQRHRTEIDLANKTKPQHAPKKKPLRTVLCYRLAEILYTTLKRKLVASKRKTSNETEKTPETNEYIAYVIRSVEDACFSPDSVYGLVADLARELKDGGYAKIKAWLEESLAHENEHMVIDYDEENKIYTTHWER